MANLVSPERELVSRDLVLEEFASNLSFSVPTGTSTKEFGKKIKEELRTLSIALGNFTDYELTVAEKDSVTTVKFTSNIPLHNADGEPIAWYGPVTRRQAAEGIVESDVPTLARQMQGSITLDLNGQTLPVTPQVALEWNDELVPHLPIANNHLYDPPTLKAQGNPEDIEAAEIIQEANIARIKAKLAGNPSPEDTVPSKYKKYICDVVVLSDALNEITEHCEPALSDELTPAALRVRKGGYRNDKERFLGNTPDDDNLFVRAKSRRLEETKRDINSRPNGQAEFDTALQEYTKLGKVRERCFRYLAEQYFQLKGDKLGAIIRIGKTFDDWNKLPEVVEAEKNLKQLEEQEGPDRGSDGYLSPLAEARMEARRQRGHTKVLGGNSWIGEATITIPFEDSREGSLGKWVTNSKPGFGVTEYSRAAKIIESDVRVDFKKLPPEVILTAAGSGHLLPTQEAQDRAKKAVDAILNNQSPDSPFKINLQVGPYQNVGHTAPVRTTRVIGAPHDIEAAIAIGAPRLEEPKVAQTPASPSPKQIVNPRASLFSKVGKVFRRK